MINAKERAVLLRLINGHAEALNIPGGIANPHALEEAVLLLEKSTLPYFLGVKDSPQINRAWISALKEAGFLWHTLDPVPGRGRAVEPDCTNPITGRMMTGSSAFTARNVLTGINDLGMGTDGGGSVLYPALSLNLYGVLLAGAGFQGASESLSTDGIAFTPGMGIFSFDADTRDRALSALLGAPIPEASPCNAFCSQDAARFLGLPQEGIPVPETEERLPLLAFLKGVLEQSPVFVHYEEQIDMNGVGCSVLGSMDMKSVQQASGKKLGKIVNMLEASAFTIPSKKAGSGCLIIARKGRETFFEAWALARTCREMRSQEFLDYFGGKLRTGRENLLFKI